MTDEQAGHQPETGGAEHHGQAPAKPAAPEPSYEPRPPIDDLIMTVERGLQIVQGDDPSKVLEKKGDGGHQQR